MEQTDEQLLQNWCTNRDAHAFQAIVQRHATMVFHTAHRILRNQADAEDTAQACFEKLISAQEPRKIRSLGAWLHGISTNLSLKHIRTVSRRAQREKKYVEDSTGAEDRSEWNEISQLIDEGIQSLEEGHRSLVIAHFLEGRSHTEIAAEMDLTRSGVTKRIHKGVDELERFLKRKGVVPAVGLASMLASQISAASPLAPSVVSELGKMSLGQGNGLAAVNGAGFKWLATGALVMAGTIAAIFLRPSVAPQVSIFNPPPVDVAVLGSRESDTVDITTTVSDNGRNDVATIRSFAETNTKLSGRIFDMDTGEGIESRFRIDKGEWGYTDEDGNFEVEGLEPGIHTIVPIRLSNYMPDSDPKEYIITLKENEIRADLEFGFTRGITIRGRIVDQYGKPVAHADVNAAMLDTKFERTWVNYSNENGDYIIPGLRASEKLYIHAAKEGLAMKPVGPISMTDDGLRDVTLRMIPEATISGKVMDRNGLPMEGLYVYAKSNQPFVLRKDDLVATDPEGNFTARELFGGEYELTLLKLPDLCLSCGTDPGGLIGVDIEPVALSEGQGLHDVSIIYPDDDVYVLSGRILTATGEPLEKSIKLTVFSSQGVMAGFYDTRPDGSFHIPWLKEETYTLNTIGNGYPPMLAGPYEAGTRDIEARFDAFGTVSGLVVDDETDEPIPNFTVYFVSLGINSSRIDESTALVVRHASVSDTKNKPTSIRVKGNFTKASSPSLDDLSKTVRGEMGVFVKDRVPPGRHVRLAVEAPGYEQENSDSFRVHSGKTTEGIVFRMKRKNTPIRGTVISPDGHPVSGAVIMGYQARVYKNHIGHANVAKTDDTGQFFASDLPSKTKTLYAYHEDYAEGFAAIPSNDEEEFVIQLTVPGTIEGRVLFDGDPSGEEEHITISMLPGYGPSNGVRTDFQGQFLFTGLVERTYLVSAQYSIPQLSGHRLRWSSSRFVEVGRGQRVRQDFEFFTYDTKITGVLTRDGEDWGGNGKHFSLEYEPMKMRGKHTVVYPESVDKITVDDSGRFEIVGVPPGEANLELYDPSGKFPSLKISIEDGRTTEIAYEINIGR